MNSEKGLQTHLSPVGAWAFSVGTCIGWGSLVVTASTYLKQAGPLGSALGLAVGALVMLMIGRCYAYMIQCYPEAGGAYAFTREVFGYDQAFLTAWFLAMTYFAILWANATSLPLFSRIFLGGNFRVGKLYTLFGYDVYLGEALLSMAAMVLAGLL
ncbi:MAG: APC family permease, partial [Clostridia bacterium]|nr:APC family permease [Clostridia bacterium]